MAFIGLFHWLSGMCHGSTSKPSPGSCAAPSPLSDGVSTLSLTPGYKCVSYKFYIDILSTALYTGICRTGSCSVPSMRLRALRLLNTMLTTACLFIIFLSLFLFFLLLMLFLLSFLFLR